LLLKKASAEGLKVKFWSAFTVKALK